MLAAPVKRIKVSSTEATERANVLLEHSLDKMHKDIEMMNKKLDQPSLLRTFVLRPLHDIISSTASLPFASKNGFNGEMRETTDSELSFLASLTAAMGDQFKRKIIAHPQTRTLMVCMHGSVSSLTKKWYT